MTVSATTVISAPAGVVFDILADPRRHPEIDGSGTVTGTVTGPDRLALGARFGMQMKNGASYKTANRVVEFEPDRLIAWRHQAPHRWRYELTPQADGATLVTETWDISRWPLGLRQGLNLVYGAKTRKGMEQTLVNLKAAAEQDAGAGPA